MHRAAHLSLVAVVVVAAGCDPPTFAVSVPFRGVVGDADFACGQAIAGLGSTGAAATPRDFRFYVHGVTVTTASGEQPLTLDDDDFQHDGIALLDFEDGSAACETGSPLVHDAITGTIPVDEAVTGVAFTVGVPEAQNHLDAATAEAPLNVPSMWWSWAGGYKFMKLDVLVGDDQREAFFHHGATTCEGTPEAGFSCAFGNSGRYALDVDPAAQAIAVDLGALYAGIDLDAELAEGDFIRGCMAFSGDPQCPAMFGALGLGFEGAAAPTTAQSVFRVVDP